ncbi:MAG: hypothetical protein N2C12_03615, partial [Planctomycetales bacterium]
MIVVDPAIDTDSDGLSDIREAKYGTNSEDPDSDDDGLLDGEEVFTYLTDPLHPDSDRDDLTDGEEVDTHGTDPADVDTDGDGFGDGIEIDVNTDPLDENDFPEGPPDPNAVATRLDKSVVTTVLDSTEFIWNGSPPIQTGMSVGTIKPERAAVLRGHVMDREGAHLPGAVISIKDHPEFGQTISRVDGMFDMVVNGGGLLTINYTAEGSLPAQRQLEVPWQDYIQVPDVVMISLDSNVTLFDLDAGTMAVAQGSEITDGDGTRQATLMCPPGTTAELVFPDGSTQAVNTLNIRATEYTVGEMGPQMMPAMLPPTSAYTYAVELSADEALSAGATDVQFSQPLPFYVENFLDFPVGLAVPTGYYDRSRSAWVASDNGLVIEIVGETTGLADVDLDGDGIADTGQNLADLGITDDERENLATLYEPLQSLWRVPIAHFTPWDHNWPYSQPDDAKPPRVDDPEQDNGLDKKVKVKCTDKSSIIECQSQILGEKMAVIGTPFRLNYRSDRMPGYAAARSARFFLSNETVPASLKRIELNYSIAGQSHKLLFPPEPEQSTAIFWDGMDVYGRKLGGSSSFSASIDYIYDAVYRAPSELQRVFAELGDTSISSSRENMEVALSQRITAGITVLGAGSLASRFQGLGGWTLDPHHVYDVNGRTLLKGSGQQRRITSTSRVAYTLLDADTLVVNAPAGLNIPRDVAVGANGSIFIVDSAMHRVLRRSADGTLESFAGTGEYGFNGDGGPATAAQLARPFAVALGPDGSLYIADKDNYRIRR